MKSSELLGFILFAAFTMSIAVFNGVQISSEIFINRSQAWEYGFAQAALILGVSLAISAYGTYKGVSFAKYILFVWALAYSIVITVLVQRYFPSYLVESIAVGVVFSALWFFLVKRKVSAGGTHKI